MCVGTTPSPTQNAPGKIPGARTCQTRHGVQPYQSLPSPIRTIPSALDFHQVSPRKADARSRGLNRKLRPVYTEHAVSPPVGNFTLPRRFIFSCIQFIIFQSGKPLTFLWLMRKNIGRLGGALCLQRDRLPYRCDINPTPCLARRFHRRQHPLVLHTVSKIRLTRRTVH